ncbi:Transmembrane protein [Tolypocladium capitatum]|uniref:Transmembrane protein n=1 Tax=Tolypocladium capitatum TaxID=45235 RepID=A0A2K3QCL9_9HYPO|nr:Transmembrane protein [Tolypocladium capitatum]
MRHRAWDFNIDGLLNPFVPPPPWRWLPYPVARFLGYRKTKPRETGNLMPVFWAFVGIFCAILLIEAVSKRVPSFESHGAPIIVGSFGAAAVLEFYAIEAPLAQPRNAVLGQLISTLVGVAVAKLFQLSDRFDDIQWVGGALACASATAAMALTKTVHPPAGATALLAVVDTDLVRMGWFLVPVIMLGCALMLAVALLVNNIERRFPVYWWTPEDLRRPRPAVRRRTPDEEMSGGGSSSNAAAGEEAKAEGSVSRESQGSDGNEPRRQQQEAEATGVIGRAGEVVIRPGQVIVPAHMSLTHEELRLLEAMSHRL